MVPPATGISWSAVDGHGFARPQALEQRLEVGPRLLDGKEVRVRATGGHEVVEHLLRYGVERHRFLR